MKTILNAEEKLEWQKISDLKKRPSVSAKLDKYQREIEEEKEAERIAKEATAKAIAAKLGLEKEG